MSDDTKKLSKQLAEWIKDLEYKEGYVEFQFNEKELTIHKCNLWNSKIYPDKK